jgi:iron complex transport system substrate-binding protein
VEVLEQHPIWQQLSAVKEGNIYLINGDLVSRPGPRITQGLEEMAKKLHPELFD